MARQIFVVDAWVVDANGTFNHLQDYPTKIDSNSYQGDVKKAERRAQGVLAEVWGAMCKVDTRQIQTVTLTTVDGFQLDRKTTGEFPAEEPEPEQGEGE